MSLMTPMTYLFVGDTTNAILECDEILSVEALPNPGVFLIRGWAHAQRGEYENAAHDFSRFIDEVEGSDGVEAPMLRYAYRLRAACYEYQDEWNLSLSDLQSALRFYDEDNTDVNVDDVADLRNQHRRVVRKQAGESSWEGESPDAAVSSVPQRHEVLNALVDGDLQRALELCELRLSDISTRFLRGLAKDFRGRRSWGDNRLRAESDFEDAISDYSDVIEDATSHFLSRAYVRRSQLLIALQRHQEAIAGLDELDTRRLLNAHDPLNIRSLLDRGIAALRIYEYNAAGKAFDRVLDLDPENIRALDGNGQVDLYTENRQDALECFQRALETSQEKQEKVHFMVMIALTYYLDEKYDEAMAELKAIEPLLLEIQDSEIRELQQKVDILRQFLPDSDGVPDSEEEFEEQRQLFKSSAEKEEKCTAYLLCILYELLHRRRSYPYVAQ